MSSTISASPRAAELLFAGDIYCDIVFAGVEAPEVGAEVFASGFAISPGGVANRAVAAARSGAATRLLSRLGEDPLGRELRAMLAAEARLDLTWVQSLPDRQTPVSVSLTSPHNRSFITYYEELGPLLLPSDPGSIGAVHVGVAEELAAVGVRPSGGRHDSGRRGRLGLHRPVVPGRPGSAGSAGRLRAQRRRGDALHP